MSKTELMNESDLFSDENFNVYTDNCVVQRGYMNKVYKVKSTKRVGYNKKNNIPSYVLQKLNEGTIETSNLVEGLAIDFITLAKNVCPKLYPLFYDNMSSCFGITKRMRIAGQILASELTLPEIISLQYHVSDTVRGWCAYAFSVYRNLSIQDRLCYMRKLADDDHFAVREWAWLSVRSEITDNIEVILKYLYYWTLDPSENIRRFASESTRPRGVWCKHIPLLKEDPEQAMPLLECLKDDESRYVQTSVGNWLNDAAKTNPDWVKETCKKWLKEDDNIATAYICKRALRRIS